MILKVGGQEFSSNQMWGELRKINFSNQIISGLKVCAYTSCKALTIFRLLYKAINKFSIHFEQFKPYKLRIIFYTQHMNSSKTNFKINFFKITPIPT